MLAVPPKAPKDRSSAEPSPGTPTRSAQSFGAPGPSRTGLVFARSKAMKKLGSYTAKASPLASASTGLANGTVKCSDRRPPLCSCQ